MSSRRRTYRFAIASLFVAATLAACSDGVTSVRLEIVVAPSLSPDGLAVTMDGSRHEEEMTESLQLLVPDDWAGTAQRIEVEGTQGGATVAAGVVVVTPIAGQEVTAIVTLVDASCDLVCGIGDHRCDGDGVVTCELGADGCPSWSAPTACPTEAPYCSSGSCSDACTDECTSGATICDGTGSVRTCGQADSDSCLDWTAATSCPGGQVCAGDACTPAFALTVIKIGSGTVTSSPSGIVCGASCTADYAAGIQVTLTATPATGSTFAGWSGGGCSGVGTCVVTISAAIQVTATFAGTQVDAGAYHTCGVKADGTVACWGDNADGAASPPTGTFANVSAGGGISHAHTCGVKTNGVVACWGANADGQASPPTGTFADVSAGAFHTCGVKTNGTVACWGWNTGGQASPPTGAFKNVSAGWDHTCGVKTNGAVACWGDNTDGQASPPAGTFAHVSAGQDFTCGLKTDGTVACWGHNADGQASPPSGSFANVSAGWDHVCGVKTNGAVACWGSNMYDQANPPTGTFSSVSAGGLHSCGVKTNGTMACWGSNYFGQASPP